jgi:hypothetical protein
MGSELEGDRSRGRQPGMGPKLTLGGAAGAGGGSGVPAAGLASPKAGRRLPSRVVAGEPEE